MMKLINVGFRGTSTKLVERKRKTISSILVSRMLSTTLMVFLMPFSVVSMDTGNTVAVEKKEKPKIETNIALDTKTYNPLSLDVKKIKIEQGESMVEKKMRLAREAEQAKKDAEASRRAKALADVRARSAQTIQTTYASAPTVPDPADFDAIYRQAEVVYGVDWRLLRAVHYVETGCSGSTAKSSYAGAVGPMQFLPSTWRAYGVDANGDGRAEITNVVDAIHSAARYLKACGYPNIERALWGYNPSYSYRNKVMTVAHSLGL